MLVRMPQLFGPNFCGQFFGIEIFLYKINRIPCKLNTQSFKQEKINRINHIFLNP